MKKWICMIISLLLFVGYNLPVYADGEDYSDEDYWYSTCSQVQETEEGVSACLGFQEYQKEQWAQLQAEMEEYKDDLDSLEANASKIEELVQKQQSLASSLESQISNMETTLDSIALEIENLQVEMDQKQAEIDEWQEQISSRMRSEQVNSGTNILVDLIMGASNLNEIFRRYSGMERITASDQEQIEALNELKAELELKKTEQQRLSDQVESQKEQLESEKAFVQELEESYDSLEAQYEQVAADLREEMMRKATMTADVANATISSSGGVTLSSVSGFINPISGGTISAGTWAYSSGGLHLGLDWATSIGTPVYAPADGIILYAANPAPSNGGYLGNWTGWPYGGGNTVEMLCQVDGTLYAISFAHLSQEGMAVSAGQQVSAGQVICLTGNSGNSSGPHCHIEVYNLGSMSVDQAISKFSAGADFAWGTGWNTTATACEAGYSTPCRERPEKYFG